MGNHRRCYPLTVTDNYSRYLLLCRAIGASQLCKRSDPGLSGSFANTACLQAIRTENGAPFASIAIGGVSELSKWWIQLGIRPERIKPGKPSQIGRHERMHSTLNHDVAPQPTHRAPTGTILIFSRRSKTYERSHEPVFELEIHFVGCIYTSLPRPLRRSSRDSFRTEELPSP